LNVMDSAGSSKLFVRDDGNVGIGTTSPAVPLEVIGIIKATGGVHLYAAGQANATGQSISSDGNSVTIKSAASVSSQLKFDTVNNVRMLIDQNGNVGIGTTSPGQKFQVHGNIVVPYNMGGIGIGTADGSSMLSTLSQNSAGTILKNNEGDGFKFDNSVSTLLRITDNGNVGIGTTSPRGHLDVKSEFFLGVPGSSNGFIKTNDSIIFRANYAGVGTGNFFFTSGSANTDLMYLEGATARVGIGTTSPGYKLTVNGEPGANGYTAFTNYSDRRLKTDIQPLDSGSLNKIMTLKPSSFHYNELSGYDEETRKRKIFGFIAQDLLKVFPKMVNETIINGKKYFDTNLSSLQIYLVKAIQELKTYADRRFGEHSGRIAQLERENSEVRAQNLELRNYLCEKDPEAPFCGEI
jgi:hypothetical protein